MSLTQSTAGTSPAVRTTPKISISPGQPLYVLHHEGGVTCFGFENARDHTAQISQLLADPSLAFTEADFGQLSGYERYQRACAAWAASPLSKQTYFDPRTDPKVASVLERYRKNGMTLRVFNGDAKTGADWLEEFDVVGTIGRSSGTQKVPLLMPAGESYGSAILTACVVRLVDWETGRDLYRHPLYQVPEFDLVTGNLTKLPYEVLHKGAVQSRFASKPAAMAYIAYMSGLSIEPRVFND